MSKRPLLYLVAGFFCAGAALLFVAKQLGGGGENVEMGQMLFAAEDIPFGSELVLQTKENGNRGNVKLVQWRKAYILAGAIQNADFLKGKTLRSNLPMVKHQAVLEGLIVDDEDFMPADKYSAPIEVNPRDVVHARPGERVDVFQGTGEEVKMVMRRVLVLPPTEEDGKRKSSPNTVCLLIAKRDIDLFLKVIDKAKLRLAPSQASSGPMEFVRPEEGFEAPSAQQLKRAETLIRSNRHQEAHTLLAAMDIGALDPAQMEVRKSALKECEALLAGDLYMQAAEALGAKDYEQCRKLCRSIAQQYPTALSTIGEATRLEARVAASLQQDRYVRDLASLNKLLEGGNLPEALRELEKFKGVYARYEPLSHLLQPEDFASDYEQKIEAKTRVFKHMHQILEYYMTQNDKRALAKLEEMREEFPEHPYVEQTEEKLRDNVVAAPP